MQLRAIMGITAVLIAAESTAGSMGAQGRDDIFFYLCVLVVLFALLLFDWLCKFIKRILLDIDYRHRLKQVFQILFALLKEACTSARAGRINKAHQISPHGGR